MDERQTDQNNSRLPNRKLPELLISPGLPTYKIFRLTPGGGAYKLSSSFHGKAACLGAGRATGAPP